MKFAETATAVALAIVTVTNSGCGGAAPPCKATFDLPSAKNVSIKCDGVGAECCSAVGKGNAIGACGRNEQVNLYTCVGNTTAMKDIKFPKVSSADGALTNGMAKCTLSGPKGSVVWQLRLTDVCCKLFLHASSEGDWVPDISKNIPYADPKLYPKDPYQWNVEDAAKWVGKCSKDDQKIILAESKKKPAAPAMLAATHHFQASMTPQVEALAFTAAEENDLPGSTSPLVCGALGFVAGAAVVGLGVAGRRYSRRGFAPLEEPMVA